MRKESKNSKFRINVEPFLPVGDSAKPLFLTYGIFITVLFLFSLQFFYHFSLFQEEQAWYFTQQNQVIETEYFGQLLKQGYCGLPFMFLWCFYLGFVHYLSHHVESKSIYLMKRLSNPRELFRRIWTFPLFFATITVVFTLILLYIYYQYYLYFAVPDTVPENQLEIFVDIWFQGGEKYANIRKSY